MCWPGSLWNKQREANPNEDCSHYPHNGDNVHVSGVRFVIVNGHDIVEVDHRITPNTGPGLRFIPTCSPSAPSVA